MTNDRDDDTPRNPRVQHNPKLAAAGFGELHLSVDDMLSTAAACYSVARSGHDALKAGDQGMTPAQVAQLYMLTATWLRVAGNPAMDADIAGIEKTAADVIREAAVGDLDRIRKAATAH